MTAVTIIRHPQTTWNVEERYQGRLEAPLSSEGERQSALTVAALRDVAFDAVYSSPLSRARYLADAIAGVAGLPVTVDHRLTEIAMGPWEGLHRDQIAHRFPQLFAGWYSRPDLVKFPGGEDIADVASRARSAMADLLRCYRGGNVCMVTHSTVVMALAAVALGLDFRNIHRVHTWNAGISLFRGETALDELVSLNGVGHLLPDRSARLSRQNAAVSPVRRIAS